MLFKSRITLVLIIIALVIIGWSCDNNDTDDEIPEALTCIDVHSQPAYPELGDNVDLEEIIQLMDENNVARSILSARIEMRYSFDIATLAETYPDRIVAAVSLKLSEMNTDRGFLNGLSEQVQSGRFDAIAEMLLYHAAKTDSVGNPTAPEVMFYPSDSLVTAVIKAAAYLDCPLFFHIEFVSLADSYGVEVRTQYMNEFKQLLVSYPNQKFILTHVAELNPDECKELIDAHSNIYFTTNFMDLTRIMTGEPVSNYSESEWNGLLTDHQDRFLFAFDRVFPNQWAMYSMDMNYTQEKLADLPDSVANAIAYGNAEDLFNF